MLNANRVNLVAQMGGEIIHRAFRLKRIEYKVIPSSKINASDIQSLRNARYCVQYGVRSEWLDIVELTILAQLIVQNKAYFESKTRWNPSGEHVTTQTTIEGEPSDDLILLVASKTVFADPVELN